MPPDSSAIQPPETPVPRRSREYCRRCQHYDITCSPLHFQTRSRCENCLNAGVICEYEEAAENVSQRRRGKAHQRVIDDSTEGREEEASQLTPTRAGTGDLRGEVATSALSGTDSSYADPELDDFFFSTKIKQRGSERKLQPKPFASSCVKPELDGFVSTKKSKPKDTNCSRKNANRKKSPRELPSSHSATTSTGSDTDGESQLMLNPHGMRNVSKFGLLRSQALVYRKEEERKKQERLGLDSLEDEESTTDFHVSEPEPYDGYSSNEDKEQERQRKARSITANSSLAHNGLNDATHSPLSPALNPDRSNSPSHHLPDISSHTSPGGKDDRKPESSHECEKPFVVAPITAHPALASPTHPKDAFRSNVSEIEPETIGDVATPNGNISSASFVTAELTPHDQVPLSTHVGKDTPIRDASQPEWAASPGDKPAIQGVPFHSTALQHQGATIQVRDTPYPLAKSVAYKKHAVTGAFKTLRSGGNPAGLRLDDDEIIPCTAGDPSSSQSFEIIVPVHQGIKRKNSDGSPIARGKKGQKRPRVLKLEFGSQEMEFKDLSDLAKEHKKRYLEGVGSGVRSAESGHVPQALGGHKNVGMQATDRQRTLAESGSVANPLPPPLRPLSSMNITIPSPTPMQHSILKPKVSPVLVAQMSESSRRSSTSSAHVREKPPPKLESSTQKALKAIIAAKRASLSDNLPGPISPSNTSRRSSSTVSRPPPSLSKNTLHCVPPLVPASHSGSLLDQRNPSWQSHPPIKAAQYTLQFWGSDDTESDMGVIPARPFPPRPQDAKKTLIPTVTAPPPPEEPERIGNYAGIMGLDVNVLIPGYNRLSAEKKSKLNVLREAYFGPGKMEVQSSESVMMEEESRQRRIQEFRDRLEVGVPRGELWWQEDGTAIKIYSRRLGVVGSVRKELERRGEGITRVELERLSRGGMVRNVMRMLERGF